MIASILLASLSLAPPPPPPPPMLGGCAVSKLWGTEVPQVMPADQDRHTISVQGKQIYWRGRAVTVERAVAEVSPDMALGSDMLVIDASSAKCDVVKALAAAMEGPAACAPERCFVSSKPVPKRKDPEEPKDKPAETPAPAN